MALYLVEYAKRLRDVDDQRLAHRHRAPAACHTIVALHCAPLSGAQPHRRGDNDVDFFLPQTVGDDIDPGIVGLRLGGGDAANYEVAELPPQSVPGADMIAQARIDNVMRTNNPGDVLL